MFAPGLGEGPCLRENTPRHHLEVKDIWEFKYGVTWPLEIARMTLSGLGCRLQTCSCLATEWFNSTFRAGRRERWSSWTGSVFFVPGDSRQCQARPSPGAKGSAGRAIPMCHRTRSTFHLLFFHLIPTALDC